MVEPTKVFKFQVTQSIIALCVVLAIVGTFFCANSFAGTSQGHEVVDAGATVAKTGEMKYGLISAAAAFGLGAIGAGIAIAHVGAAAVGAVAEKPQIAGQALIFVALAEGLVVFGFITALMILGKV